ncbi:histamine H3 receptor-like [Pecten maximus]|uniref:histamine H3 receptor-like n=1 Tax=Pecten maximus TaxID=6579 RepID=UPI0014584708|nr:histamine H3 receptor-like [Pecten maximus]
MYSEFPTYAIVIVGIVIAIIMLSAILGNSFVILAFIRDEKLRTVYNIYLVNLALTDLLLGCISMPLFAVYTLNSYKWIMHRHSCTFFMTINEILCCEVVIMMVILSWDRLKLLTQKLEYMQQQTIRSATIKVVASWIISFLIHGPVHFVFHSSNHEHSNYKCSAVYHEHKMYSSILTVIQFTVPFLCLCIINSLIFKKVRTRIKRRETARNRMNGYHGVASTNNLNALTAVVDELTNTRSLTKASGIKRALRIAKNLALLVFVFFVTWAPYSITYFVDTVCTTCVNEHVTTVMLWVLWSKSAMNPFLYNYMSPGFKENFKAMVRCHCKR